MSFQKFAKLVNKQYQKFDDAFVMDVPGDEMWQLYLSSFPEGTNPLFRERTEHDCNCCKSFVRRVGNLVSLKGNKVSTVWDTSAKDAPYPYNEVAAALRDRVLDATIREKFFTSEGAFGKEETISLKEDATTERWNHFFTGPVKQKVRNPDTLRGQYSTAAQVFARGLRELTADALEVVADLIASNNLYRGAEHKRAVSEFQKLHKKFHKLDTVEQDIFIWMNAEKPHSRFRSTVIGTLVQDISEGKGLEAAVGAFESKVAPHNYKRTTALVTPGMVKKAMETIEELGLEPALERRFARIEDISVNDVLWVDREVEPLMKGGLGDELMSVAKSNVKSKSKQGKLKAEEISIDNFIEDVLPNTSKMEVLLDNAHVGNLMSLTAPVHPEPAQLFKWDNDFAWSYNGNIADSIKERVRKAGGNVTNAKLRASLSWFNFDDLDIHVIEPNGSRISYSCKRGRGSGQLDVDMNVSPNSREAVENVAWTRVEDGDYKIIVHNYTHRERVDVGFVIEVESGGKLMHFNYPKMVNHGEFVNVATLHVENGIVKSVTKGNDAITSTSASQECWGLKTEEFVKVKTVTMSPNYWGDNAVGNKHHFFVLEGAENDEGCRGIYNEFLHGRLEQHRKVFELIGEKTKCQPTEGQLSGLGFSTTKKDVVVIKTTTGKKQRLFNVRIGA